MSYHSIDKRRRFQRNWLRSKHHGRDWRKFILEKGFMCSSAGEAPLPDNCWVLVGIELHSPENGHNGSRREVLCKPCHARTHNYEFSEERGHVSMLFEDVMREMGMVGGETRWVERFRVGGGGPLKESGI